MAESMQPIGTIEQELLGKLKELEEDKSLDLTTNEGRALYATRMSEIQAGLELMQRVLLKHGLEGGFIEETTKVLAEIEELEPTENMSLVPAWFVDVRTGNPAIFIFPTNPSDALGEASVDEVYTPNGLWFAKAPVYPVGAILCRVFPLPNYNKNNIVPTPVWQVESCAWTSRLNSQALHLYHFDESVPWGRKKGIRATEPTIPLPAPEPARAESGKKGKKGKELPMVISEPVPPAKAKDNLLEMLKEKYTPEKYFQDIKLTVDSFKCNEVFFLLQTLQVRYVTIFSQLIKRIYGEQLYREMTIAAALEEYLNMRKGFGESISDSWFKKLSDKVLIVLLICSFAFAGLLLWLAMTNGGGG